MLHSTSHPEPLILLPASSRAAQAALSTGWLPAAPPQRVIARGVVPGLGGTESSVAFEPVVARAPGARSVNAWLRAIRAFSLTATVTPCIATYLLARGRGWEVDPTSAITAAAGVVFLQIAVNLLNDVEDYRRLIDLPNTPGGSGVIQSGEWTPKQLRTLAWSALGLGAACGLYSVLRRTELLALVAVVGGVGVMGYSGFPLRLKYRALGDLAVFALCGPVLTIGYALAISGRNDPATLLLGLYFGLLATALLHINNLQDMKIDHERGISTLALTLGFRKSQYLFYALYATAYGSILATVVLGLLPIPAAWAALPPLVLLVPLLARVARASGPESHQLTGGRVRAAQVHLVSGVALCFGLWWAYR